MLDIVLAEDEPPMVEDLRRCLESGDHSVRTAANGDETLAHVRERVPDLVITDIVMPQRDGIETIIELRSGHPGIKLIAMAGARQVGAFSYLTAAVSLGADAVLAKPFTTGQLLDVIASLGLEARALRNA